jgi:hypothetical protein
MSLERGGIYDCGGHARSPEPENRKVPPAMGSALGDARGRLPVRYAKPQVPDTSGLSKFRGGRGTLTYVIGGGKCGRAMGGGCCEPWVRM